MLLELALCIWCIPATPDLEELVVSFLGLTIPSTVLGRACRVLLNKYYCTKLCLCKRNTESTWVPVDSEIWLDSTIHLISWFSHWIWCFLIFGISNMVDTLLWYRPFPFYLHPKILINRSFISDLEFYHYFFYHFLQLLLFLCRQYAVIYVYRP